MKFTIAIFTFFAAIAIINAGPISISDNNVGDIVTVGVNADLNIKSNIEANFLAAIILALSQQGIIVAPGSEPLTAPKTDFSSMITPELLSKAKDIKITPEMIDGFKKMLK